MATSRNGKGPAIEAGILFPLKFLPSESGWGDDPSLVTHNGIRCEGPSCVDRITWIQGVRYKCSVCPKTDFCSTCVRQAENNHDRSHRFWECHGEADFVDARGADSQQLQDFEMFSGGGPFEYLTLGGDNTPQDDWTNRVATKRDSGVDVQDLRTCPEQYPLPGTAALRLIDVFPGDGDEDLQCTFRTTYHKDAPPYMVIMGPWKPRLDKVDHTEDVNGPFTDSRSPVTAEKGTIFLDGSFLEIDKGISDALRALRAEDEVKTFWIDRLCSDQEVITGRKLQIRAVGLVFNSATGVIVWAGKEDDHTENAFQLLELLAYRCEGPDEKLPTPRQVDEWSKNPELELPLVGAAEWTSLLHFLRRPVFNPRSSLHNIAFAKEALVKCSKYELEWWKFARVSAMLNQPSWRSEPWLDAFELDRSITPPT